MTRRDAKRLEFNEPYPNCMNGRMKMYEEVFISSGGEQTAADAQYVLSKIQECHPLAWGWYCATGHEGVFHDEDGRFYAYRHHAQYV